MPGKQLTPAITSTARRASLLVDAHAHLYPCYPLPDFLEWAATNFRAGARELGLLHRPIGCLMLADPVRHYSFCRFGDGAVRSVNGRWTFHETSEDGALIARRDGRAELILVAGRQLETRERLEVLALGTRRKLLDGLPVYDAIDAALNAGAVPVLAWGFGKWWLARGALAAAVVGSAQNGSLFVGDGSGRLGIGGYPRLFEIARRRGILILPGSATFPFAGQVRNVARYGFALEGEVDLQKPAEGIKKLLHGAPMQPRTYGVLEKLPQFCLHQVKMQIRRRARWGGVPRYLPGIALGR